MTSAKRHRAGFVRGGPTRWTKIEQRILARFQQLGLPSRQQTTGLCMLHLADFPRINDRDAGSHAKFYMIDHAGFYVGSQNMYPSSIPSQIDRSPQLDEFGYYFDADPKTGAGMRFSTEATDRIVIKTWNHARQGIVPHTLTDCERLPYPVHLHGQTNSGTPMYTCDSDFDLIADFHHVAHNEVAKFTGHGTCASGGKQVEIDVSGTVGTDHRFIGIVHGKVAGVAEDSVPLTGLFVNGELSTSFEGLEPIHNVRYDGWLKTRLQ